MADQVIEYVNNVEDELMVEVAKEEELVQS
jgi:hypothetical protein